MYIHPVKKAEEKWVKEQVLLILLSAQRIPPHLLLSIAGKTFSLGVKGASIGTDIQQLLKYIHRTNTGALFIQLSMPAAFSLQQLQEEMKKHLLIYPKAEVGGASCLYPIKDFCKSIYETPIENVQFVFDLIAELEKQQLIQNIYQLYLEPFIKNDGFTLKTYTKEDVDRYIYTLESPRKR